MGSHKSKRSPCSPGASCAGFFRQPFYLREMIGQMDVLGVGSLVIILLTGFFTGGVLALNSANTLQTFRRRSGHRAACHD